jgi:hypothetical protein
MNKIKHISLLLVMLLLTALSASAQNRDPLEEFFYASGKIRVVIAVFGVILLGLFGFLYYLERKLNKWEKQQKHH